MKTRYDVPDLNPAADLRAIDAARRQLRSECGDAAADDGTEGPAAARLGRLNRAEAMLGQASPQPRSDRPPPARTRPVVRGIDARWPLIAGILALAIGGAAGIGWLVLNPRDQQAAVPAGVQADALTQERQVQQQLQLEIERLKAMVELMRREQDLRAKASDSDAARGERELNLRERSLNAAEADRERERSHRVAELDWVDSDRRVRELENAARLQRENAAARLGVTDQQYQRLLEERGREGSGLH